MKRFVKGIFLFFYLVISFGTSLAQTDSTAIKLKHYNDLYAIGLVDSQEYVALKAKLLGLSQPILNEEKPSKWKVDQEIYYDTTSLDKILPGGIYMSLEEIKTRNPSLKCTLTLKLRGSYDYSNGVGGNIIPVPTEHCVSKKTVKMDAWIYSDGIRCYINLERLKLQPFYNPIITMGRYLAFYKNQTTKGVQVANDWAGQWVGDMVEATGHFYKRLYVIDVQTAMLYPVNKEYMLKTLKDFPEINSKYSFEKDALNPEVCARYLQMANEAK